MKLFKSINIKKYEINSPIMLAISGGLIFILNYAYITYVMKHIGIGLEYSLADCIIESSQDFFLLYTVIPISLFHCLNSRLSEYKYNYIGRFNDTKAIWNQQIVELFINAVALSTITLFDVIIVGIIKTDIFVSFNQQHSVFTLYAGSKLDANPSIIYICIIFFVFCSAMIIFTDMFVMFLNWLNLSKKVSIIVGYACIFVSAWYKIFFYRIGINFYNWLPQNKFHLEILAAGIVLMYIVGYLLSDKKEFIYGK